MEVEGFFVYIYTVPNYLLLPFDRCTAMHDTVFRADRPLAGRKLNARTCQGACAPAY